MCGCLSHAPYWGPGPQPRHVPWLEIEPVTLWCADGHSIHWATAARALVFSLKSTQVWLLTFFIVKTMSFICSYVGHLNINLLNYLSIYLSIYLWIVLSGGDTTPKYDNDLPIDPGEAPIASFQPSFCLDFISSHFFPWGIFTERNKCIHSNYYSKWLHCFYHISCVDTELQWHGNRKNS